MLDLDKRAQDIFHHIVTQYLHHGDPVGSRTLSKLLDEQISAATIRNVMADLADLGLLHSPHISAGRVPTADGLRLFVKGMLEIDDVSPEDKNILETLGKDNKHLSAHKMVDQVAEKIAGLSQYAGFVFAPNSNSGLKHIEFVPFAPGKALVILVTQEGVVENRLIDIPNDITPSMLSEAGNFMSQRLAGKNLDQAYQELDKNINERKTQLNELSQKIIDSGMAFWSQINEEESGYLILKGQSQLLDNIQTRADIEQIQHLFSSLERDQALLKLLNFAKDGEGVQLFIGSENEYFSLSGWSLVLSPYQSNDGRMIGAIGLIGPINMNYARVIPVVNYTAKLVSDIFAKNYNLT